MFKKSIIFFSLIVSLSAAQNPKMQMSGEDMYNILKPQMSLMYKSIIPMMDRAQKCFSNAKNKDEALKCSQMMIDESSKFMPGMSKEILKGEDYKDFEWNDKIKKETVESIAKSKEEMIKMQNCIENSKGIEDLNSCMKEIGIEKR